MSSWDFECSQLQSVSMVFRFHCSLFCRIRKAETYAIYRLNRGTLSTKWSLDCPHVIINFVEEKCIGKLHLTVSQRMFAPFTCISPGKTFQYQFSFTCMRITFFVNTFFDFDSQWVCHHIVCHQWYEDRTYVIIEWQLCVFVFRLQHAFAMRYIQINNFFDLLIQWHVIWMKTRSRKLSVNYRPSNEPRHDILWFCTWCNDDSHKFIRSLICEAKRILICRNDSSVFRFGTPLLRLTNELTAEMRYIAIANDVEFSRIPHSQ